MTIDSMARSDAPSASISTMPADGLAGVITAGAMTFLLSGDLRLAMRATRLVIADGRDGVASTDARSRPRRWRQPSLRSRRRR